MKIKSEWEKVNSTCQRLKVFGGWLVVTFVHDCDVLTSVFVPDKNHEWEVEK